MTFHSVSYEDWQFSPRKAKVRSMRGADGFSVQELRLLPEGVFRLLKLIFAHAEKTKIWPSILTKTWVILLPKTEGFLTWKQVRPISMASMIYRTYVRIRTCQILHRLPPRFIPFVNLGTPTTVHWATLLDKTQYAQDSNGILAGIVCDLLKAFNCLNRQVILMLPQKGGIPSEIINPWSGALDGLQRQVQMNGFLFGNEQKSTTGFPEGDPLSVTALFILIWNFGAFLQESHPGIEFRAFADNLELVGHNTPILVKAFESLISLTKLTKVEISADKSWSWANTTDARIFLARKLHIDDMKISGSYSEKNLGAAMRYSCKRFCPGEIR